VLEERQPRTGRGETGCVGGKKPKPKEGRVSIFGGEKSKKKQEALGREIGEGMEDRQQRVHTKKISLLKKDEPPFLEGKKNRGAASLGVVAEPNGKTDRKEKGGSQGKGTSRQ